MRRDGSRLSLRSAGMTIWFFHPRSSQPEHEQHQRVALIAQLRRIGQPAARHRARTRHDRHVLFAVDLESHRRGGEARADVDLPQLLEAGVVVGRHRTIEQRGEDQPAAGRQRARVVRVLHCHALLDLAGERVDGGDAAFPTIGCLRQAAVPAELLVVLGAVDGDGDAVCQGRDIDQLGLRAVRARPVVIAAGLRRTDLLERLIRI